MKKYFVVADVHGFYDEMRAALKEAGFEYNNPDHIFVSLGDLLDRGEMPMNCLHFVNGLPEDRKILIRGNHEDLMEQAIQRGCFYNHDWHNGTAQTAMDLYSASYPDVNVRNDDVVCWFMHDFDEWNKYVNSTRDYWENDKWIFVHGWIPVVAWENYHGEYEFEPTKRDWRTCNWKNARWYNGMEAWRQGCGVEGKTIFCGHWHCSWGHKHIHHAGEDFGKGREF